MVGCFKPCLGQIWTNQTVVFKKVEFVYIRPKRELKDPSIIYIYMFNRHVLKAIFYVHSSLVGGLWLC